MLSVAYSFRLDIIALLHWQREAQDDHLVRLSILLSASISLQQTVFCGYRCFKFVTRSVFEKLLGKIGRERLDTESIMIVVDKLARHLEMEHAFFFVVGGFESRTAVIGNK